MDHQKAICVIGTPSGGTSCVSGVLHHLGVDMGRYANKPGIRGYATFEDVQTGPYKITPPGAGEVVVRQRLLMRQYLEARRERQGESEQPWGFKGSALWWLDDKDPATLPLRVVRVVRPLEDAIRSDWRIQEDIAHRRPDMPRWTPSRRQDRAEALAATWAGCEMLEEIIPAVVTVRFYDLLLFPSKWVYRIAAALDLPATDEQKVKAVAFVDPEKRHV